MGSVSCFQVLVLIGCLCFHSIRGSPIASSVINCVQGSVETLGPVDEEYSGDVELFTGVPDGVSLQLVQNVIPADLQFLELHFTPGSNTAVVRTQKPLDAEALTIGGQLMYSVMCSDTRLNNSRTLKINDLNDNSPVFSAEEYTITISESLPVNSHVIKVDAKDLDVDPANNRISYYIKAPAPTEFEIRNDGTIVLKKSLNYNQVKDYNFLVEAQDVEGLSDTARVIITVEDFDNLNPYFSHNLYNAAIKENNVGEFLTILPEAIQAQDGDIGINMPVVYSLSSVNPGKFMEYFSINQDSGVLTVVTALDREEVDLIVVNVKAAQQDDSQKTANAVVSVKIEDENDNPPEFDKSQYFATILENSPDDSYVLRAIVTDKDQGGFNGTLQVSPDSAPFSISNDGTLRVKESATLDRERTPSFVLQIEAHENTPPNNIARTDVTVTLLDQNDNSPQFKSSRYEGRIYKNQTVGMPVVKVEAEDPDEGANGEIAYAIDGGHEYFSMNETTGEISLKQLILLENKIHQFFLIVTARDGGQGPRASSVSVYIQAPGDSKPQFSRATYHGQVEEEKNENTPIVKVDFVSVGSPNLRVLNETETFSINSQGVLSTLIKLDYETQKNYYVHVSISDSADPNEGIDEATVLVEVTDINDNDPVFASHPGEFLVPEDAEVGSNLTEVLATDADGGFNGKISYSLRGGDGMFTVHPESAWISLARELDREGQAEFQLDVVAQDQGQPPRSATVRVAVKVGDVNDNAPRFLSPQYEVFVQENVTIGHLVLKLSAEDPDEGANGTVSYHIIHLSPLEEPVFTLDPNSGELWLSQLLDRETVEEYTLTVVAEDDGTPKLGTNCSVLVRVQDVNDNVPKFESEHFDISVPENWPSGAALITLEVTDKDKAGFSDGYFIFNTAVFSINQQGTVFLNSNASLDREERDNYMLQVVAVDSKTDGLSATTQLNITVLDVNDNSPQFLELPDPAEIAEGEYSPDSPGEVYRVNVTDADHGDNGRVTLSISSSGPSLPFQFREDGTLVAVGPLDRESTDAYDLVIMASDHGIPVNYNITQLRIRITDVNDNDPEFSQGTYSGLVLVKTATEGDVVLILSATDKDVGNNSLVTYSFSAESPLLHLDGRTGAVTVGSGLLNVTENMQLNLTAVARDHGTSPRSSTATETIHVKYYAQGLNNPSWDLNLQTSPPEHYYIVTHATVLVSLLTSSPNAALVFERTVYNFSVVENEPKGTTVGQVTALLDGLPAEVTYTLQSYDEVFSIDTQGTIHALHPLDREGQEWYTMAVQAADMRIPPYSALSMVTVQVGDVNEPPVFNSTSYSASVFSVSPYRHPVVQLKATDPDAGENGQLQYRLLEPSLLFDVEPSSGQVYVVSLEGQRGQVSLQVKATDRSGHGLSATTVVEVTVESSAFSDVVIISLNRAPNMVESKVSQLEKALELDWTVDIIGVTDVISFASSLRSSRNGEKAYIRFIATDSSSHTIVPSPQVRSKLQAEQEIVTRRLEELFGDALTLVVEEDFGVSEGSFDQATIIITLGVLLALSIVGLVTLVTVTVVKSRKLKKNDDPYKDNKNILVDINTYRAKPGEMGTENQDKKQKVEPIKSSLETLPDLSNGDSRKTSAL